jgi:hypothetical protein
MFTIEFGYDGQPLRARVPATSLPATNPRCPSNAAVQDAVPAGWKLDCDGWRTDPDGSVRWEIEAEPEPEIDDYLAERAGEYRRTFNEDAEDD